MNREVLAVDHVGLMYVTGFCSLIPNEPGGGTIVRASHFVAGARYLVKSWMAQEDEPR